MEVNAALDSNMKDQSDVVSNGTDSIKTLDSELPADLLKNKLKGNMDGFGIVSRNGESHRSENGNGVSTNGVEGDDEVAHGSEENSVVDSDQNDVSMAEEESNDASSSQVMSVDDDDSKAVSVDDDSKAASVDEDSKAASVDEDSNAASVETGSGDKVAESQEGSVDMDEPDITDDKTNDGTNAISDGVDQSNDNTRDSAISAGPSNDGDSVTNSNENTMDNDSSSHKTDDATQNNDKKVSESESNAKDQESVCGEDGVAKEAVVDKDGVTKATVVDLEAVDKGGSSNLDSPKDQDQSSKVKKDTEPVVIDDSPRKAPQKPTKPSKVDRLLANDKSQGSSSSGSEQLRPFARLLFDLGLDMTRQHVYKDLIRVQSRKQNHNKLNEKEGKQLDKLKDAHVHLVDKNKCFSTEFHKCSKCNYKSDSINALAFHKEFDHKGACSLCDFVTGNASAFYFHMEAEHNRQGRVEPVLGMFVCPHCPYEHHSARKNYLKHLVKCEKGFDLKKNLQPMPADCDIPLKPSPVSVQAAQSTVRGGRQPPPLVKKPNVPVAPIAPFARNMPPSVVGAVRPATIAPQGIPASWPPQQDGQAPQVVQMGNQFFFMVTQNGQTFMTPVANSGMPGLPSVAPGVVPGAVPPQPATVTKPAKVPEQKAPLTTTPKGAFEICEICGGFVKDRDSLRIHFFWAHKIEIHPSLMKAREPALKCNNINCLRRFWTYQGYQRHVTVAHGGEASRAPSPGMTCYVCGITTVDFITHMTAKHPQVVKHMLSQMRCVVCQDGLPTETALESHMFTEHKDVVTKYGSLVGGMNKNSPKKPPEKEGAVPTGGPVTNEQFQNIEIDCFRCDLKFCSTRAYGAHFSKDHSAEIEPCVVCQEDVQVGNPFIQHVKDKHLKALSVPVMRLSKETIEKRSAPPQVTRKRKSSEEVIVIDLDEKRQKVDDSCEEIAEDKPEQGEDAAAEPTEDDAVQEDDDCETLDDSTEEGGKKVIEEIMEVDGEEFVIQKMVE